jgi:transposase
MKRTAYSIEIKNKAIKMKIEGYSTKEIMDELNVRNKTQIKTWWKWYRNGETHRFHQQVGKQYSYGKGHEKLNSEDKLKLKIRRQQAEIDILKKYKELERKWRQK